MRTVRAAELALGHIILRHGKPRFEVWSVDRDRFTVGVDSFDLDCETWKPLEFNVNEPVSVER